MDSGGRRETSALAKQQVAQAAKRRIGAFGYAVEIPRVSWRDLAAATWPVLLITAVAVWIAFHFVRRLAASSGARSS